MEERKFANFGKQPGTVWSTIPVRIGVGTVIAVLGVGRVIALFNYIFMRKFVKLEIK